MNRGEHKHHREHHSISPWGYFGLSVLYAVPVIGWLCCLIISVADRNVNRRNHARSMWCGLLVAVILIVAISVGSMVKFRVSLAQVPARLEELADGIGNLLSAATGHSGPATLADDDMVLAELDGRKLVVHRELKQTLDKAEEMVDTFAEMAAEGRTGKADLIGLTLSNLGTVTTALSLYEAELGDEDKAYMDAVIERSKKKLEGVDLNAIDLSWLSDLGIRLPK